MKAVEKKVESAQDFAWQSQLKFYWDPDKKDVINICDFSSVYSFEYGQLWPPVITPLTDRCYVTLTTALRLFLGGALLPRGRGQDRDDQGPGARSGRAVLRVQLQRPVQLPDHGRHLQRAQPGWRLGLLRRVQTHPIEVPSVVATQVKLVQDAILKFSVPTQREDVYQHLPAGTPSRWAPRLLRPVHLPRPHLRLLYYHEPAGGASSCPRT